MSFATVRGLRKALLLSVVSMAAPTVIVPVISPAMAQETAGQMNGLIRGADGQPLANADVRIVHLPSGSSQTMTTNAGGRFISRGLRLGGPYEVTVTPQGASAQVVTTDAYVALGQPYDLDYALGTAIEEMIVTGQVLETVAGASQFNREQIARAPGLSRDFKEVLKSDSKVYIDRFNSDAIQIAGSNNRFNLLTIDGVRQNDDFGLNNGGYPSLRSPLSIDVIDQLSVNTTPFGVTYSGFQGGNINIVTKSGTNDWTGSAYYYYSDDNLLGSKTKNVNVTGLSFKDKTWGATLGGPVVKDKLFFFAGYENFKTSNPVTTGPAGGGFPNSVAAVTQADYDRIKQIAQSVYGYDMMDLPRDLPEDDEKIFAKLDWDINDDHRAVVSYNRAAGSVVVTNTPVPVQGATSSGNLGSGSNWYNNEYAVDSVSAQLFSDWTSEFKTEFKIGYKNQKADPTSIGEKPFAEMQVRTPGGGMLGFGPDVFRHFNSLANELVNIKAKGDYLIGDHTVTAGYEREMLDVFNAFLPNSFGNYYFASIDDFEARRASILNYSNAVTNVQADGAAQFKTNMNAFYVQDEWGVSPELTLTAGLRYEMYSSGDEPRANPNFLTRYGFSNTETYDGRDLLLPRLSFKYTPTDTTTVRGGVGLFGGGNPNVWLSNSYSNDGVGVAGVLINRANTNAALVAAALDNVQGDQIPLLVQQQLSTADGSVNAIHPDFKIPSSWKVALGIDQTFNFGAMGDDWLVTADVVYSKVNNATNWVENRVIVVGTTPDGRPIYGRRPGVPSSGNDLVMVNTDEGRAWVATLQVGKSWETTVGTFDFEAGYTWTDILEINPATSSTAQSNWDNLATSNINDPDLATSNYELKRNVVSTVQWTKALIGEYETGVSFFGQNRSGRPYSYTFSGSSAVFGDPRQGSRQRQLFYVPSGPNDVILAGGLTWEQLDAYITQNGLDKYRGEIAPRNAFRSPDVTQVDMRITQEIPGFLEGHRGVFSFDIRNLTNLIDSDWGQDKQVNFPFVVPVVQATGIQNGQYVFSGPITNRTTRETVLSRQSVWQIQVGVRYEF